MVNNQDALGREYSEKYPLPEFREELSLMLEPGDMARAKQQAERSGLLFEDYMRALLHQALKARRTA